MCGARWRATTSSRPRRHRINSLPALCTVYQPRATLAQLSAIALQAGRGASKRRTNIDMTVIERVEDKFVAKDKSKGLNHPERRSNKAPKFKRAHTHNLQAHSRVQAARFHPHSYTIVYIALYIPHSTHRIPHSAHRTPHTAHCTPHTAHPHTAHRTPHMTYHTPHA